MGPVADIALRAPLVAGRTDSTLAAKGPGGVLRHGGVGP
jgi:hypothetical protein